MSTRVVTILAAKGDVFPLLYHFRFVEELDLRAKVVPPIIAIAEAIGWLALLVSWACLYAC